MSKPKTTEGTTVVSIRLENDMLELIDQFAEDDRRPRTNFIKMLLEDALEDYRLKKKKKSNTAGA